MILRLILAGLLLVLAARVLLARRGHGGARPLSEWLYIAAMLLMAVPLLLGRALLALSILGALLLIASQIWAGYAAARKK